ncbi:lytic transglycosylase domain-containing protein [Sphingomonas gilva]|uniref:Lytic transglycosylase domain-containing protein n=1 Tax=Sphingomonas gilva TaxID=2305907 RepID=A0A396RPM5_9SPHN|nr:lytic transglycosylase domain-containing protein [Sphingomonas gilva]RHW18487.1 lytic transglycosylase domain-containing protein [Sphingomonas gilva]
MTTTGTAQHALAVRRERVADAVWRASARTGVDFGYLMDQARVESGFDADARARTSSATGLFQFIEQSWLGVVERHGAKHGLGWAAQAITRGGDGRYRVADGATRQAILGLRRDPDAASAMAAEFASDNADVLQQRLGRPPNATDLYFAHFLGAGGAAKFLAARDADPGASAAALLPQQAAANRNVFFTRGGAHRSLDEVYRLMAAKLGNEGGAPPTVQMAARDPIDSPVLSKTPPGPDTTAALAARPTDAEAAGSVLRPSPAQARLAYLMVVSTLGA